MTLAIHRLVVQTPFVKQKEEQLGVLAYRNTLVIPMLDADQVCILAIPSFPVSIRPSSIQFPLPECVINSDCSQDKACIQQKCKDPCPGSCGANAICRVSSHNPICSCPNGYTGDPLSSCRPVPVTGKIDFQMRSIR